MVYSLHKYLIPNLLTYIRDVENRNRKDGTNPLLRRMIQLLLKLDSQPNLLVANYRNAPTTVFYRTLEYYTLYYFYNGTDAIIIDADINDGQGRKYNLRDEHSNLTGFDFSELPQNYKTYRTSNFDYGSYIYVRNNRNKKFNLYDPINHKILLDLDYDEIIPFNQYDDGFYGKGYLYGDKGWYKLFVGGGHQYLDTKETNESLKHRIVIKESQLHSIIHKTIRRLLLRA